MNKQFLWLSLVLLIGYLALVFCDEHVENSVEIVEQNNVESQSKELFDEARTRRRHKLFHLFWGWHAIAIAYWIKVKVVIVSFFLGSAVFLGLRYFWPHRCKSEISHEGPIIYDNPHISHHDHIPYALDHSEHFAHDHEHSFEPYSGYAGAYSETGPGTVDLSGPPDGHSVKRRSLTEESSQRQGMSTEEQIAELMFSFLGLDSKACRRRFICEMEFRSKRNPISSMAFRIVGRGFFEKYTNARNTHGRANSFTECALVNPDCVFIEQTDDDVENVTEDTESVKPENDQTEDASILKDSKLENDEAEANDTRNDIEAENETNLAAEKRNVNRRRRKNRNGNDVRARFFPLRT